MDDTLKELTPEQKESLLATLRIRFEQHPVRHPGVDWPQVQARLAARPEKLWSLAEMERTGGQPDMVGQDEQTGEFLFMDCSPETPAGRRNFCYDRAALDDRKEAKPENDAMSAAQAMGITILTVDQYASLQTLGEFDTKTSSWLSTPAPIRKLGGAIFGDRRYNHVFTYHNGAQSYYGVRGFRGLLRV